LIRLHVKKDKIFVCIGTTPRLDEYSTFRKVKSFRPWPAVSGKIFFKTHFVKHSDKDLKHRD